MAGEKKRTKTKKSADEKKAMGEEEASPKETVAEEAVEKAGETIADVTAVKEGKQIEEEPKGLADEEKTELEAREGELKKPLEKMTAKELREVALGIPGISGVHTMKKEELLISLKKDWGIKVEKAPKKEKKGKARVSVAELKSKIRGIKAKRAEAIQRNDKRMAAIYRRMINRLKKRTRRAA